jgi:hypothetical protein
MANTTNINELPVGENIQMTTTEQHPRNQEPPSQMKLDQTTINQIVSGLQAASVAGITQLPSRDIPRSVEQLTQDPHVQPNFIEQTSRRDYIKETDSAEDMIRQHEKTDSQDKQSEQMYDELQTPVLLSILYFLFQLPILRKLLSQYLPVLFGTDGNININGLGFMSIAYGGCYYFLDKIMKTI